MSRGPRIAFATAVSLVVSGAFTGRALAEPDVNPLAPKPGFLVAVSIGAVELLENGTTPSATHSEFGIRLGARFRTGVSTALAYDDLGLRPHGGAGTPWQVLSMSARYTFYERSPSPYGEGLLGLSFLSSDAALLPGGGPLDHDLTAGLGGGVAFDLREDLSVQLGLRVLVAPAEESALTVFTLNLGVELDIDRG